MIKIAVIDGNDNIDKTVISLIQWLYTCRFILWIFSIIVFPSRVLYYDIDFQHQKCHFFKALVHSGECNIGYW